MLAALGFVAVVSIIAIEFVIPAFISWLVTK